METYPVGYLSESDFKGLGCYIASLGSYTSFFIGIIARNCGVLRGDEV